MQYQYRLMGTLHENLFVWKQKCLIGTVRDRDVSIKVVH